MTLDEINSLTDQYLRQSVLDLEHRLSSPSPLQSSEALTLALLDHLEELNGDLATARIERALPLARELAPSAEPETQRVLARRLLEVQLRVTRAELEALDGQPLPPWPSYAQKDVQTATPPAPPSPLLAEVAQRYAEERVTGGNWTPKTALQSQTIFEVICDLLGNPPVRSVTKDHIWELRSDIIKLPANMSKRFPGRSPKDVLSATEGDDSVARLEPRSVNKYFQHVRSLFGWAVEHDHIEKSPASILKYVEEGRAQDARKAFSDEDIVALFEHVRIKAHEDFQLWIPRILAFTGCRLGEAAQLRKQDIRKEQEEWVIHFTDEGDNMSLKTDNSRRLVPVHPRLIQLGLIDLVRDSPDGFLFPERIRTSGNDTRNRFDRLSKQMNRWVRDAGITDKKKVFQSFRATFATRLKQEHVEDYLLSELMGHEDGNITTGRYGKRSDVATLSSLVRKLKLPI